MVNVYVCACVGVCARACVCVRVRVRVCVRACLCVSVVNPSVCSKQHKRSVKSKQALTCVYVVIFV